MEADLKKQTQKSLKGNGDAKLDVQDLSQEVPDVDGLLSEIDAVLRQTDLERRNCRC